MTERPSLSQSLIDLGLVLDGALEEALVRQVIYGGPLETTLLELEAVGEDELGRALAHSTGLVRAPVGALALDVELSRALVERGLPLAIVNERGGVLLVSDATPEPGVLDRAREVLSSRGLGDFQPAIAPTFRLEEAKAFLAGRTLGPRLAGLVERFGESLAEKMQRLGPSRATPGAAQTPASAQASPRAPAVVAVSPPAVSPSAVPAQLHPPNPEAAPVAQPPTVVAPAVLPKEAVFSTAEPPRAVALSRSTDDTGTAPPPRGYAEVARSSIPPEAPRRSAPPDSAPESRRPPVDLGTEQAIEALGRARDRDKIVALFADYASQLFEYVAVFSVQAGEARGVAARGAGASESTLLELKVPLDLPSAFTKVRDSKVQSISRFRASGLEGGITRDLERPTGRAVLLVPVTLRDRVVMILWGDEGVADVNPEHTMPILALVRHVSAALERVLLQKVRASRLAQASSMASILPASTSDAPPASKTSSLARSRSEAPAPHAVGRSPSEAPTSKAPSSTKRGSVGPTGPAPTVRASVAPPARTSSSSPPSAPSPRPPSALAPAPASPEHDAPQHDAPQHSAPAQPPLEAAPRVSRAVDELQQGAGPAVVRFPSDTPKTLRGFPATPGPGVVVPRNPSPTPFGPPLLSRRVVSLAPSAPTSDVPPSVRSSLTPAPAAALPSPPSPLVDAPPPPLTLGKAPGSPTPAPGIGSLGPIRKTGTLISRRPALAEPPADDWSLPPALPEPSSASRRISYAELVERLVGGDDSALPLLEGGGEAAIGGLIARFPGPIIPGDPATPLADRGPILRALLAFGTKATPFLTVRTADSSAEVRRWAVALLGEAPGRDAARAIARRMLDDDVEVRRAALQAARRAGRDTVARRTLRAQLEEMTRDPQLSLEERCAAIEAIADTREHESIPTLLKLLESNERSLVRATRWALTVLTRHDFGDRLVEWQAFWQKHREEDRTAWLLLALDQNDVDLRRAAHEELKALSGQDHPLGDEADHVTREQAKARYRSWFQGDEKGRA